MYSLTLMFEQGRGSLDTHSACNNNAKLLFNTAFASKIQYSNFRSN